MRYQVQVHHCTSGMLHYQMPDRKCWCSLLVSCHLGRQRRLLLASFLHFSNYAKKCTIACSLCSRTGQGHGMQPDSLNVDNSANFKSMFPTVRGVCPRKDQLRADAQAAATPSEEAPRGAPGSGGGGGGVCVWVKRGQWSAMLL